MSPNLQYCFELLLLNDQKALDLLMSKFGEALRYFAFKQVKCKSVAEDIVAESFCKLWFNREKLKSGIHIRSYLYFVTNNACIDYLRSSRVKYIVDESIENYEIINSDDDLLATIFYNEFLEKLIHLSNQLPKMQSEVFKLSILEGLNTKEICDILHTSESTVYFSKSKAILFVRNALTNGELAFFIFFMNEFLDS